MLPKYGFCTILALLSIAVCYGARTQQRQQPQYHQSQSVQQDKAELEQFQLQQQFLLLQKQHQKHQQQKQQLQLDQTSPTTVKIATDTSKRQYPPFLPPPPFPPFGPGLPPFLPPPFLPPRPPRPPQSPPPGNTPPQFPFPFCFENPTNQLCRAWLCSVFPTNAGCTPITPPPPPPPPTPPATGVDLVEFCRQNPWVCQLLARQDWFCRSFPQLSVCIGLPPITPPPTTPPTNPADIINIVCSRWPWVCQPPADWCIRNPTSPLCPTVPGQPAEKIIDWICMQTAASDFRLCASKDSLCAVATQLWLCQPSTRIPEYVTEICSIVPLVCPRLMDRYGPDATDSTTTALATSPEETCRQYPWICSTMTSQSESYEAGREFNITIPLDLLLQNSNIAIPDELLQQNLNIAVPAAFLIGDSTPFATVGEKEAAYKPAEFKRPAKRTKLIQARRRDHRFW